MTASTMWCRKRKAAGMKRLVVVLRAVMSGVTQLHAAAQFGYFGIVEALLRGGADPNSKRGASGATPLHVAAKFGFLKVVEALLQSGADPNARADEGMTALHAAARGGECRSDRGVGSGRCGPQRSMRCRRVDPGCFRLAYRGTKREWRSGRGVGSGRCGPQRKAGLLMAYLHCRWQRLLGMLTWWKPCYERGHTRAGEPETVRLPA